MWCNLLTSQLLVYDDDRQAPPDLSNLLPEGTDSDPDTWLTRRILILGFLRRIANASIIQQKIFLKELVHIYKILQVLDVTKFHPNVHIVRGLRCTGEMSPKLEKPPTWKDTVIHTTLHRILRTVHSVSSMIYPSFLDRSKSHDFLFVAFSYPYPKLVVQGKCSSMPANGLGHFDFKTTLVYMSVGIC
jgi:hypothetical protein